MRLYTEQSLVVSSMLFADNKYYSLLNKSNCFGEYTEEFLFAYRWMLEQLNARKRLTVSTDTIAPIFWYTDIHEVNKHVLHQWKRRNPKQDDMLLYADVPEDQLCLYDADMYDDVLMNAPIGQIYNQSGLCGGPDTWDSHNDEKFERYWSAYKKPENLLAKQETWKEIFNLTKKTQKYKPRVHAITGYIDKSWL